MQITRCSRLNFITRRYFNLIHFVGQALVDLAGVYKARKIHCARIITCSAVVRQYAALSRTGCKLLFIVGRHCICTRFLDSSRDLCTWKQYLHTWIMIVISISLIFSANLCIKISRHLREIWESCLNTDWWFRAWDIAGCKQFISSSPIHPIQPIPYTMILSRNVGKIEFMPWTIWLRSLMSSKLKRRGDCRKICFNLFHALDFVFWWKAL